MTSNRSSGGVGRAQVVGENGVLVLAETWPAARLTYSDIGVPFTTPNGSPSPILGVLSTSRLT